MIVGSVNADHEAIVCLVVVGSHGREREVEAIVDTGYTGSLTLPSEVVFDLDLPYRRRGSAILADGSESLFNIHEASIAWAGRRHRISIDVTESDPLLGMELLHGNELAIQVIAGGAVTLRQLRLA
jgi:clan AA aspartic protease